MKRKTISKTVTSRRRELSSQKFTSLGGDIEAFYDGGKYIDIRVKGSKNSRIFASRGILLRALAMMEDGGARAYKTSPFESYLK